MGNDVIEIRPGRRAEASTMATMSRDLVEDGLGWSWRTPRILRMMRHPECLVLAATHNHRMAGFAIMEFHTQHAHLNLLAVAPDYRRQGIAGQLLDWLTQSAQVAGLQQIVLEVRENNTAGLSFYERLGYTRVGVATGYYQQRENAVRMCHRLVADEFFGKSP